MDLIGDRIKVLRNKLNLTQKEFCKMTGINQGRLSDMESNKTKPSFGALLAIKEACSDISLDWLITGIYSETNIIQNKIIDKEISSKLTIDENNLLNLYRKTTDEGKTLIQEAVTEIWAENQRPKSKLSQYQNSKTEDEISSTKQLA